MEYRDKNLVCVECHQTFVWTAGEQLFYADKNFKNEPKRCKDCKSKRNCPHERAAARARGDDRHLLAVRQGDHRPLQADPGPSGVLQGVLPAPQDGHGLTPSRGSSTAAASSRVPSKTSCATPLR